MRKPISINKKISVEQITLLLRKSKSKKQSIAINGTGMFIKHTYDDNNLWRFVIYDMNPCLSCNHKSIRMQMSKTGLNEIEGFNRWQKLAKTNGVNLTLKETPIKTTQWDEILTALNNYLSIPCLSKDVQLSDA